REGMRQAFLRAQTGAPDDPACQVHWARMPAYVRGAATERQRERLLGHVDACDDCRARLAALMHANDRLPALVGPALLLVAVGGTGKYLLASAGAAGAAGAHGAGLLHGVRHAAVGGAKAPVAVAAGAVVAGAAAVCLIVLGPADSSPAPAQRTPVADVPALRTPVAEAPPPRAAVRAEAADDHDTSVQAADVRPEQPFREVAVATPTAAPRTDDEPAPTETTAPETTAPAAEPTDEAPSPVETAPGEKQPPTDDGSPEAPEPSTPAYETPEPEIPQPTATAPAEDPDPGSGGGGSDCDTPERRHGHDRHGGRHHRG
ncbi:zf-HC2 domain-containing protein, partial [Streptomyces sp. NPDC002920]